MLPTTAAMKHAPNNSTVELRAPKCASYAPKLIKAKNKIDTMGETPSLHRNRQTLLSVHS